LNSLIQRASLLCGLALLSLPVLAGEAEIRKALSTVTGDEAKVVSMQKTPYANLYEVVMNTGDIVYADPSGNFIIAGGSIVDIKNHRNITAERSREVNRIKIADLPFNQAFKQVHGNGKRTLVTFEDPNCGYCKKLAKDLKDIKDVTIYTFMIPILAADSADKSRNIWCSADKAKAWNEWMVDGKPAAEAKCDNPIRKNAELAHRYRIEGTPTLFFADGNRAGGYMALAELDKAINDAEAKVKPSAR